MRGIQTKAHLISTPSHMGRKESLLYHVNQQNKKSDRHASIPTLIPTKNSNDFFVLPWQQPMNQHNKSTRAQYYTYLGGM